MHVLAALDDLVNRLEEVGARPLLELVHVLGVPVIVVAPSDELFEKTASNMQEVAARGGLPHATYTWGDDPEGHGRQLANYWHGEFPWRPDPGYGRTTAVGSFPPNGYGLFDMAGNVWEWTATPERKHRVLRGGCWYGNDPSWVRAGVRNRGSMAFRSDYVGFRCSRSLVPA